MQCGVACFCYDKALQRYDVRAYNFYLWPEMSSTFSLQSDSLRFLSSHGFDFNRLIAEGIQYLTPVEEAAKRNKMETWLREEEEAFNKAKAGTAEYKVGEYLIILYNRSRLNLMSPQQTPNKIHIQEQLAAISNEIKEKLINGSETEVIVRKANRRWREDIIKMVD